MTWSSLEPEAIESVECLVSPAAVDYLKFPEPKIPMEAKYSIQFCCAAALADGKVSIESFTQEKLSDPITSALMRRVSIAESPKLAKLGYAPPGLKHSATVVIRLRNGEVYSHEQDRPNWGPDTPPSWESLVDKYRACAERVLSADAVAESVEIMEHLEEAPNLHRLLDLSRG